MGVRLQKICIYQLAGISSFIFTTPLSSAGSLIFWKDAVIVPKAKTLKSHSDFWLFVSLIIKTFERIIKAEILNVTQSALDPLQFEQVGVLMMLLRPDFTWFCSILMGQENFLTCF